jgi:hypothetical protein
MCNAARLAFVVFFTGLSVSLATAPAFADENLLLGTWVLDREKSEGQPGALPDSWTLVVTDLGSGMYKSVSDNMMAGIHGHEELIFATDGKDYEPIRTPKLPDDMPRITQSYERVNAMTYKVSMKLDGKVIATALEQVSADGMTLTATTTGIGQFAAISSVAVFARK